MEDISEQPKRHDIDADYSPQYVKLARILRREIERGEYCQGDILLAADVAHEYRVSTPVAYHALAMLATNRYVSRPGAHTSYRVTRRGGA